ncbi:MAG TPA: TRAP transporter substrate-binding protein DctP [Bacteroidota bacterium]
MNRIRTCMAARLCALLLVGLGGLSALSAQPQYTIKFATVAPDGSPWMTVMREFDRQIRKESGGRLGFKIYPNNIQGDEKDVLRKIKLGQLQSAGITGNGMTTISRPLRILDAPFLFKSADEADAIHKEFDAEFNKAFEENGFVNLGWAEVGFIYVFSNTPVRSPDDLKKVKMWMWEGDPIAEAAFKTMNVSPISLSITDVLTSLQTNLIDGFYTSPLGCIALQWFSRSKYMLDVPLANASGAVIISRKKFEELPADLREILLRNGAIYMKKLTDVSRRENEKAMETLRKNGITIVEPPSPEALRSYEEIGRKSRRLLVGNLYSQDLLDRVERAVAAYRTGKRGTSK